MHSSSSSSAASSSRGGGGGGARRMRGGGADIGSRGSNGRSNGTNASSSSRSNRSSSGSSTPASLKNSGASALLTPPSSSLLMMGTSSQELSVRIAQEMSAVLDVDDEWDRHQKIQRALQKQNFTINKLRMTDLDLFGRESEVNLLKDSFRKVVVETASTNKPKVALVNVLGRSGTGKTRLCLELKGVVTSSQHSGFFLTGKFDLQNRQEPFTGLVSALSGLKEQVLARGGQELADKLSSALLEEIGSTDFRMLTSVVPGLELLLIKAAPTAVDSSNNGTGGEAAAAADADIATVQGSSDPTPKETTAALSYDDEAVAVDTNDKLATRSSRLQYLFRQFFRCICRPEHPVVLLLDDMQWSDAATLTLVSTLVSDSSLSSLMVLATCREEEVHDEHPWNVLLSNVQTQHAKKVAFLQVALSSLDQPAVLNIVQTALRCTEERTFRLAEIVHSKSSGNAMYVIQFLSSLYDDGLLRYNVGSMSWMWDEHAVRSRFVTDNVVDLTTAKLQRLPTRMQTLLMMAACLGRTFDRSKLELIRRQEKIKALLESAVVVEETATAVSPAEEEAAVPEAPLQADTKPTEEAEGTIAGSSPGAGEPQSPLSVVDELAGEEKVGDEEKVEESEVVIDWLSAALHQLAEESVIEYLPELRTYCFAHDMIQEAASRLIPDKVRGPVQREVGRALLQSHQLKELDDNFYFRAIELSNVVGPSEKEKGVDDGDGHELARHNSEAGQRAMAKAAFGSALKYFEAGLRHLGDDGIRRDTPLFLELSSGAVEAAFCSGNSEALEKHIARAMKVDTSIENKVRVYLTRILSYGAQDKNALAIATGRQVLIEMGITRLPRRPGTQHVIAELLKTKWVLRSHTEESLLALPTLEDKRWLQAMSIIDMMQAVAYCSDMNLFAVMNLRMLRWTVRYGVCRFSPTVVATYGVVLCQIGELQAAQLFANASMLISDRLNATASRSKTIICAYALVAPWQAPYRSVFKMLQYGHKLGMKTGELEISMYNLIQTNLALAATSAMPLKAYIPKTRADNKLMREYGQDGVRNFCLLMTQFAINLVGPVDNPTVMTGEVVDEDVYRSTFVSMEHLLLIGWLNMCCLQLAYYFEDYDRADECSRMTGDFAQVAGGHPYVYRHAFFCSLTAFAMARKETGRRRQMGQWRRALRYAKQVQKWSEAGNVNCLHLTQLLEAERLSFAKSKVLDAKRMYNAAITTAHRNGYLNDKALAHERAFIFYRQLATDSGKKQRSTSSSSSSPPPSTGSGASNPPLALSDGAGGGGGGGSDDDWFWALHHYKDSIEAYCDWNAYQKAKHLVDAHGDQFKLTTSAFSSLSMQPEDESDISP